ncbi:hypothetical protein RABR111495_00365 [Rahnella bruchi]
MGSSPSKLNLNIPNRHATTRQNLAVRDERQRFFTILNGTVNQPHPARSAIAFPALVFHFDLMMFKHFQQIPML